ncbi:MAG: VOC family protein [Rhodospirillales bacterium]|nr:VOC family protein [Rhodospirillales bacterium]
MAAPLEVGIAVKTLVPMVAFYCDILSCMEISRIDVPAEKTTVNRLSPDGCVIVRLQTPNGERIKLLASPSTTQPATARKWLLARTGIAYLTFIVIDLDAHVRRLREHGIILASGDRPVENRPGLRVIFFHDPEGNTIEFVEYADLGAYRPDIADRR